MIIGLTGYLASGKTIVSNYLKEKGFIVYSCSDVIREECKKKNIELTRDNLLREGNNLREKYGPNVLTKRLIEKMKEQGLENCFVVESIRTEGEIEELRKLNNFNLIFVDADLSLRYERAKLRLKEKEHINSIDDFRKSEERELTTDDPNKQNLLRCKELSDYVLDNNGTIEDLKKQTDQLLLKLQIKNRSKPDWDEYFLNIANKVSLRGNCLSARMGVVITVDNVIKATGYSGAPRKTKDCYEKGYCLRRKLNIPSGKQYELCVSVHAEQNAIINAARTGTSILGGTLYLYGVKIYQGLNKLLDVFPCLICKKMIINAGIERVVCSNADGSYKSYLVEEWVKEWNEKDIIEDEIKYNADYK